MPCNWEVQRAPVRGERSERCRIDFDRGIRGFLFQTKIVFQILLSYTRFAAKINLFFMLTGGCDNIIIDNLFFFFYNRMKIVVVLFFSEMC